MQTDRNLRRRQILLWIVTGVITVTFTIVISELLLMFISPQASMYPRSEWSAEYGFVNWQDRQVVHKKPGRWKYVYTTNRHRNRGPLVPVSNSYSKKNIVVLGDSNTFGIGVNDGESFAEVISHELDDGYSVLNLGVGGWGLTQQVRRYYEFGQLYAPAAVILQFSLNDLRDNFNNKVTIIEDGRFQFVESQSPTNWIKKILSDSYIQKSQIYNLVRDSLYIFFSRRHERQAMESHATYQDARIPPDESFYNDLLELFAGDLHRNGVRLLLISSDKKQLASVPYIKEKIVSLERRGVLEYIDIWEWLENVTDYRSPQGHVWGDRAHAIIGRGLSDIMRQDVTRVIERLVIE